MRRVFSACQRHGSFDTRGVKHPWVRPTVLLVLYFVVVGLLAAPVQLRIWNRSGPIDCLVMIVLIAPFLATRWLGRPTSRATTVAWYACAVMAVDVLAFAVSTFAPTGGHPSLEALVSLALGYVKVLVLPTGLVSLAIATWRGERTTTVVLGLLCLIGETLYTVTMPGHPIRWLGFLRTSA